MQDWLVAHLRRRQKAGERIVSLTAYDYFTALLARDADVDFVLVGDSLGNVIQGGSDTTQVRLAETIYHARIVCRHFPATRVVVDMPFGTFKISTEDTVRNCLHAFQKSGAGGVKLEGGDISTLDAVSKLTALGIPVVGHLGLLPQRVHAEGGYRVQGRTPEQAARLRGEARALESAGAVALVLECVADDTAARITEDLGIPTIGIGSGRLTDGQIMVIHDILGLLPGEAPAFARRYADLYSLAQDAVAAYCADVRTAAEARPEATEVSKSGESGGRAYEGQDAHS